MTFTPLSIFSIKMKYNEEIAFFNANNVHSNSCGVFERHPTRSTRLCARSTAATAYRQTRLGQRAVRIYATELCLATRLLRCAAAR